MSNNKDIPLAPVYALKNTIRKMFINISPDGVQIVSAFAKPCEEAGCE